MKSWSIFVGAVLFSVTADISNAQTTWTAGNGVWSFSGNWDMGSPVPGSTVIFNSIVTSTVDGPYQMNLLEFVGGNTTLNDAGGLLNVAGSISYGGGFGAAINVPITGTGSLLLNGGTGTLTLNPGGGSNTFSGSTQVYANGTLADGEANSFSPNSALYVGGGASPGTVQVNFNETVNGINDASGGNGTIFLAPSAMLTTNGPYSNSYTGLIAGTGALISGAYIQALGGANTYSGGTTITSGTLLADNTSGSATGSGPIFIQSGGALQMGSDSPNGMVAVVSITDDGTVALARNDSSTFANAISGSGGVTVDGFGLGVVTLSGSNSYTGVTFVNSAYVRAGSPTALGNGSDVTLYSSTLDLNGHDLSVGSFDSDSASTVLLGSHTLTLTDSTASNFGGAMTGSGSLVLNGPGEFAILGAVTYTGSTTIGPSGYLSLGLNSAPGASMVGNVIDNGQFQFAPYSSDNYLFNGTITGTGLVRIVGAGVVTLENGGGNLYSGITDLVTATLTDGAANAFSPSSNVYISSGGTLAVTHNETVGGLFNGSGAGPVTIASATTLTSFGNAYINDFQGAISGGGTFEVLNGVQGLAGGNSYTGGTIVSGTGEIFVGSDTALGTGTLTFTGSAPELSPDANVTLANNIVLNSIMDNDDGGNNNLTLTGQISGPAGITWCTPGTLSLMNSNTFAGTLDMREGTLVVGTNTSAGLTSNTVILAGSTNSGLYVPTGVTFSNPLSIGGSANVLSGSGTIASPAITVDGTVVLSPSATLGGGPANLTFTNGLTLASGGAIHFDIYDATGSAGTGYSLVTASGGLNLTASANTLTFNIVSTDNLGNAANAINFNSGNAYSWKFMTSPTFAITGFNPGQFNIITSGFLNATGGGAFSVTGTANDLFLNFTPVPEPSTWALMGAGIFAFVPFALRRQKTSPA